MSAFDQLASNPILSDGVTTLRRFQVRDAEAFAAIHRDPLNIQWTGSVATMDAAQALGFIEGHIAAGWESGTGLRFAITEVIARTSQVVGTLSLQDVVSTAAGGSAHVGIKMLPSGRGTGAAQRAIELLCGYAFGNLGLGYLHWICTEGNRGSISLAQRCGFQQLAHIPGFARVADEVAGGLIFTQTAARWHAREESLDLAPVVPVLRGEKVLLRALTPADAPALVRNCRDLAAIRWTTVPLEYSSEHADYFIKTLVVDGWRTGETLTFAVASVDTDELLGTIDLQSKHPGVAAVGINVGPQARGTGSAEEAARLLLDYGFTHMNLSFIHWGAMVPNWASRKLAWKLGFSFAGCLRGGYNDRGTPADLWQLTLAAGDPQTPQEPWTGPAAISR